MTPQSAVAPPASNKNVAEVMGEEIDGVPPLDFDIEQSISTIRYLEDTISISRDFYIHILRAY